VPGTLAELAPRFLPAVPIDPFDGKPLRYAVRQEECVVWSIGIDLADNGGSEKAGGSPDVTFAVPME
jgi:hypothetical protein